MRYQTRVIDKGLDAFTDEIIRRKVQVVGEFILKKTAQKFIRIMQFGCGKPKSIFFKNRQRRKSGRNEIRDTVIFLVFKQGAFVDIHLIMIIGWFVLGVV